MCVRVIRHENKTLDSKLLGLSAKKRNYSNQSFVEITENQLAGSNCASPLGEVEGNQSKRV